MKVLKPGQKQNFHEELVQELLKGGTRPTADNFKKGNLYKREDKFKRQNQSNAPINQQWKINFIKKCNLQPKQLWIGNKNKKSRRIGYESSTVLCMREDGRRRYVKM